MKRGSTTLGGIVLALALTVGAGAVGTLLLYLACSIVDSYRTRTIPQRELTLAGFDAFGQPVLSDLRLEANGAWGTHHQNVDGQELSRGLWTSAVYLAEPSPRRLSWVDRMHALGYDYQPSSLYWNLIYAGGRTGAYCFGCEQLTGRVGGYLGTAGFRPDPPPRDEWFDAVLTARRGARVDCLVGVAGNRVYLIHFGARRVDLLLDDLASPICSIGVRPPRVYGSMSPEMGSTELAVSVPPDDEKARGLPTAYSLLLRTSDAIQIVDFVPTRSTFPLLSGEADQRFEVARGRKFPLPEVLRNEDFLVAPRADGGLMIGTQRPLDIGSDRLDLSYRELKADGNLGATSHVTLKVPTQPWGQRLWLLPLGSPLVEAAMILANQEFGWRDYLQASGPIPWAFKVLWNDRIVMIVALAIGGLLAVVCARRQARYRLPLVERIGWPLFVCLLGIPGWIGYRYSRRWPVLEDCEACHVPSPRNDETCAVCAAEFPLPTARGTEIFA